MRCLSCNNLLTKTQIVKKGKFCSHKCSSNHRRSAVLRDFSEVNEESMYWAGFIFGDGSISENCLHVCLSMKDCDHLVKLSNYIFNEDKVNKYKDKNKCHLRVTSEDVVRNLSKFGIVKNKTYLSTVMLPDYYTKDFVRGFFDADGWYTNVKYKNKNGRFYKKEILGMCSYIEQNLVIVNNILPVAGTISRKKKQELYELRWQKTDSINQVRRFLDGSIKLERKWIF